MSAACCHRLRKPFSCESPEAQNRRGASIELSLPLPPLPEEQIATLRRIAERMSCRCPEESRSMVAVFTGSDAAGKLMAVEALAYELQRTAHEIDGREMGDNHFALLRMLGEAQAENAVFIVNHPECICAQLLRRLCSYGGLTILSIDSEANESFLPELRADFLVDFPFLSAEM